MRDPCTSLIVFTQDDTLGTILIHILKNVTKIQKFKANSGRGCN